MKQEEVKDFCNYEVYEIIDNKKHTICLCEEYKMAVLICTTLAKADPVGDFYFVTNVKISNTLVPGGGWYVGYRYKDGKLETTTLS